MVSGDLFLENDENLGGEKNVYTIGGQPLSICFL